MPFPSTLSSFARPTSSDRLNNPSHSALHNTVSSAVGQIETVIGRSGDNSVLGTIIGDLRSPGSNGGGHVQTANKGGTGQTSYTKGDLLVATSSSVLAKLAVSSTAGEVLTADPGQAAGVKWAANVNNTKVAIVTRTSSIYNSTSEEILFSASIAGSLLGTNNGFKFKAILSNYCNNQTTFTVRGKYGVNSIFSIPIAAPNNTITGSQGFIEGVVVGHSSVTAQKGFGEFYAVIPSSEVDNETNVQITKSLGTAYGASSVQSTIEQPFIITGQFAGASPSSSVLGEFLVIEKIV